MAKLSIKVVIAGRSYPLTIEESEKEGVELAAADINRKIKTLQDSYAVKDVQDLLAMTALQIAVKPISQPTSEKIDLSAEKNALKELLNELEK
jgi:cell division protein ZapA (FtsZ GTPase activity inhibitor)